MAARSVETIDRPVFERMARSLMKRYSPEQVRWHYEHGLALQSMWQAGDVLHDPSFHTWVKAMYDTKIDKDGQILSYKVDEYNLDQINAGKLLFDLYRETGEQRYRTAAETLHRQMENQPRTASGGFWHKKIYPHQMWLDGVYMAEPFNARYTREFGRSNTADAVADTVANAIADVTAYVDVVRQFVLVAEKARNPKTGLLYHAWDEAREQRWANPETGCSPHFWGRALGWYCMALVDTLAIIGQDPSLVKIARSLVEPILAVQDDASGLWYQVLDQGGRAKNYLESSVSSMFCYFLYKMLRLGYAEKSTETAIRNAANRAWEGLIRLKVKEDPSGELHLTDICAVAGLGGTPYRDGSYAYYVGERISTDDFKGVGPFILAGIEREAESDGCP